MKEQALKNSLRMEMTFVLMEICLNANQPCAIYLRQYNMTIKCVY